MKGIEIIPNRNPKAWLAPATPTMSKAMGPTRQKVTSDSPMTNDNAMRPSKLSQKGIHIMATPSTNNESCCSLILLTHG